MASRNIPGYLVLISEQFVAHIVQYEEFNNPVFGELDSNWSSKIVQHFFCLVRLSLTSTLVYISVYGTGSPEMTICHETMGTTMGSQKICGNN